ncbi:MAG: acyltransferase [Desulfobacteraceae bacterium]|nr:acyltransferase [Desulfobacteraceae bacterium]
MKTKQLAKGDSDFLSYLRSLSILGIVFGHVGGFWAYKPYSGFLHVVVPVFFFLSGSVSLFSYNRSENFLDYYTKRFIGLLIPYYLLLFFLLIVFICINRQIPSMDIRSIMRCIQITPPDNFLSFQIGHVWFLHTLFFIALISPLYFFLYYKNEPFLIVILLFLLIVSGIQLFSDIDNYFYLMQHNLYKPLVHSSFYIFGIIYFGSNRFKNLKFLVNVFIIGIGLSVFFVYSLNLNIDYAFHTFAPDLYYVAGSFSAIAVILILKKYIVLFIKSNSIIEKIIKFCHEHTFSIFLLHKFSIYLSETIGGLVNPQEKTIKYGIIKFAAVIIITCILAVPFSKLSKAITSFIFKQGLPWELKKN